MRIEKEDFLMESTFPDNEHNSNWFFDLYIKKIVKGKSGDREEWKNIGYSCVTPYCIELIANYRTQDNKEMFKEECKKLYTEFKDLGLKIETKEIKYNMI